MCNGHAGAWAYVEVKGQFVGVDFIPSTMWVHRSVSGYQAWLQVTFTH